MSPRSRKSGIEAETTSNPERAGSAPSVSDLMSAAADVARLAGAHALGYFRRPLAVESKADGSPVTIADRGAESLAREWIAARYPADGLVGEEFGEERSGATRRWILDPIDGTNSFVRGVPLWGTLVAVAEGERVLAGAAYFPAIDELVVAGQGAGCWWNGARCHVSAVAAIESATVLATDERMAGHARMREGWRRLAARAAIVRTWGDCSGYLLVATGRAEVMADPRMHAWDSAAVASIVTEAGGVFTDWRGVPTAFGRDAIATNSVLAARARVALGVPIVGD